MDAGLRLRRSGACPELGALARRSARALWLAKAAGPPGGGGTSAVLHLDARSLPPGWLSVPKEYERRVADPEAVLMPSANDAQGKEVSDSWWSF